MRGVVIVIITTRPTQRKPQLFPPRTLMARSGRSSMAYSAEPTFGNLIGRAAFILPWCRLITKKE